MQLSRRWGEIWTLVLGVLSVAVGIQIGFSPFASFAIEFQGPPTYRWFTSGTLTVAGLSLVFFAVHLLRLERPMSEVYIHAERKRRQGLPKPTRAEDRRTGRQTVVLGLVGLFGGITLLGRPEIPTDLRILFAIGCFVGFVTVIQGAHRMRFGAPITGDEAFGKRIAFGVGTGCLLLVIAAVATVFSFYAAQH